MDDSSKQTRMNQFLTQINSIQYNEMDLDKLDRKQRQKYLETQNKLKDAKEKKVDRDTLKMVEDEMNFEKECTNLVLKALGALEDMKYSKSTIVPEAAIPVEEVAPTGVEKQTKEVEPKKEEEHKESVETKSKFIKYITSQNLMQSDSLALDCTCQGSDNDLELIWLRNNQEIPKNRDFRHEREGNTFQFIVTAVFPDDSVVIQARDKAPLDPSFVQFPRSIRLEKGEKAKFNCKMSGSAPMIVKWNLNGKPLDHESNRFILTNDETEFSLEIPVVLATDEGQYTVIISNDKGEITAASSLHVDQSIEEIVLD